MLVLSLLLWVTMSTLQWGACENTEDPDARNVTTNSATATTEETETETREAQRADHERPASYSQYGNQYSACENEMKATNQEVWELRQQVQMLQLKQDMTSLRSELRDLKGHVTSRQPHLGPRDTVTHTEHRDTNQQKDSVTNDTDPAVRPKKAEVKLQATSGSVYVRWGGQTCPDTASLVYSGVVGGGVHTSSGSAVNGLCLPLNPVYDSQQPTKWNAYLYGAEYDTRPEAEDNFDVVCAVCEIPRPLIIMVPATNTCHPGWTMEYTGHLMAGYPDHASATEFVCMDSVKEVRFGSAKPITGKQFYFVLSKCGTLPCPPFEDGKVLTCVVCSK